MGRRSGRRERGVALIAVVLVSALVLGLFAMTYTNVVIGNALVSTNKNTRIGVECGHGDVEFAMENVAKVTDDRTVTEGGIILDPGTVNEIDENAANGPLANALDEEGNLIDDVDGVANITIPAGLPGCERLNTFVDLDFIYSRDLEQGSMGIGEAYHESVGGTYCTKGHKVYAVTTLTTMAQGQSKVQSAYAKCI